MIRIDVSKIKNWELIKKKHSEWYEKKILPNIKKAYTLLLSKKTKDDSIKKYKELLKKIIERGENYVIEEELFLGYDDDEIKNILDSIVVV